VPATKVTLVRDEPTFYGQQLGKLELLLDATRRTVHSASREHDERLGEVDHHHWRKL
jgi:hypothetical protein